MFCGTTANCAVASLQQQVKGNDALGCCKRMPEHCIQFPACRIIKKVGGSRAESNQSAHLVAGTHHMQLEMKTEMSMLSTNV